MSKIKSIILRIFAAVIFSAIGNAINSLLNLSCKVANMLSDLWSIVLNTTWIDWLVMGLFGLIGTVIIDKLGFFLWLDGLYFQDSCTKSNTAAKNNKSLIVDVFISDLEYSAVRYLSFYQRYNSNERVIYIIPYIDNLLEILNLHPYGKIL